MGFEKTYIYLKSNGLGYKKECLKSLPNFKFLKNLRLLLKGNLNNDIIRLNISGDRNEKNQIRF